MKNIVIVGGGYGGVSTALQLINNELPKDVSITLIDRMPYQGLKTEYYALASGSASDMDIRVQFPSHPQLNYLYGDVTRIDLEEKQVLLADRDSVSYDLLVIALGCTDQFHGIEGAAEHAYTIQSLSSTRKTYQALNDIRPYGQASIVGGGLSGVELASELRECRPDLNIRIIDRNISILAAFPKKLQTYVSSWFEEHDVEMLHSINIKKVEANQILHEKEDLIYSDVTVWTAGIQPSAVVQALNIPKEPRGRVLINEYHQVPEYQDVFIVGDCASSTFGPSAQLAEAMGKQVGEVIQAMWKGETPKLGRIKLKGVLGSLGKRSGFGVMGKKTLMIGRVPRLLKSGVLWMSKQHFG